MEILPRSNHRDALKEWEYRIMLEHHNNLSMRQVAGLINRHYQTVLSAGKRLKIKFKKEIFITGTEELPNVEEYKKLYSK